jgi:hypothetical protein
MMSAPLVEIAYFVEDVAQTVRVLAEVLQWQVELPPTEQPPDSPTMIVASVRWGDTLVKLLEFIDTAPTAPNDQKQPGSVYHLTFMVSEIQGAANLLTEMGYTVKHFSMSGHPALMVRVGGLPIRMVEG